MCPRHTGRTTSTALPSFTSTQWDRGPRRRRCTACIAAQVSRHIQKKKAEAAARRAHKLAGTAPPPKPRKVRGRVLPVQQPAGPRTLGPCLPPKNKLGKTGNKHHLRSRAVLKGASWNAAALSPRHLQNIADLGHDIVCLQETHIKKPVNTKRRFFSLASSPTDPAAGTAILLSAQAAKCVTGSGAPRAQFC